MEEERRAAVVLEGGWRCCCVCVCWYWCGCVREVVAKGVLRLRGGGACLRGGGGGAGAPPPPPPPVVVGLLLVDAPIMLLWSWEEERAGEENAEGMADRAGDVGGMGCC